MMTCGITPIPTNDLNIRRSLRKVLNDVHKDQPDTMIIEELGLKHGESRVDMAVVNGCIHGYELKSDIDTLFRLPGQIKTYNAVLDKITLIVGKNHLHEAIKMVPEWWGVVIAKVINPDTNVSFIDIRNPEENPERDSMSIAKLLWREEALNLLTEINQTKGIKSKSREFLYERLSKYYDQDTLREKVRVCLRSRLNWKSDLLYRPSGD